MVQEADMQEQTALREAQSLDKKTLGIILLLDGRPQAFVDFFNLSHGRLGNASTSGRAELPLPQESLLLLKNHLIKVDTATRAGDMDVVCTSYKTLSKYFNELGRLPYSEFFLKQAVTISQKTGWVAGELEALQALGAVYEQMQDVLSAVTCHEKRLALAMENMIEADSEGALLSLTAVYLGQAEGEEKAGQTAAALTSYSKCLSAAERAGEDAVRAKSHYRMGMIHFQEQRWQEAIYHLRQFVEDGAESMGDKVAEGVAHTALAQSLRENQDVDGSVALLEGYLETAQRGGDQHGPAMACCSLGTVYFEKREFQKAVAYLERFYEIARSLNDRPMLDTARFNLGVAKGSLRLPAYMQLVNGDLPQLMQWKNSRIGLI